MDVSTSLPDAGAWPEQLGGPAPAAVAKRGVVGTFLWIYSHVSPRLKVGVVTGLIGVGGLLVLLGDPTVVRHATAAVAVAVFQVAAIAGVGGWLAVLTHRRWQDAPRWWQRYAADFVLIAVSCATLFVAHNPNAPAAQAAPGLLSAVAVWLSMLAWRAMNTSRSFWVRATSDIALSLMLGVTLVASLGCLAYLLHMPAAEVMAVREAARHDEELINPRWWLWAIVFALLAGTSLAFARWPGIPSGVTRWFALIVPAVKVSRRLLSGAHIAVLVTGVIGSTAPYAVAPGLKARLEERYTETLADGLREQAELSAYTDIAKVFATPIDSQRIAPLARMITLIERTSTPRAHDEKPARDLARRLGQLRASTLSLGSSPRVAPEATAAAQRAGFHSSFRNFKDLKQRINKLDQAQADADTTAVAVHQAADLAKTAIAAAVHLPKFGDVDVVEVIGEYLSGLIEQSPLKDVLAGWMGRLAGAQPAVDIVVPDPARLQQLKSKDPAAIEALQKELGSLASAGDLANMAGHPERQSDPRPAGTDSERRPVPPRPGIKIPP